MKQGSLLLVIALIVGAAGCSSDEGPSQPVTGILEGTVADLHTGQPIPGVRVIVSVASANAPLGAVTTGVDGVYKVELSPGEYTVKLSCQGFDPVPPKGIDPLPVTVYAGQTVNNSLEMVAASEMNTGAIGGRVTREGAGVAGVLVAAESAGGGYSSLTDGLGNYWIYNVPPDSYQVNAQRSGMVSSTAQVTVQSAAIIGSVDITISEAAMGAVAGHVSFLATTNAEVEITLLNPMSGDGVPGLASSTVGQNFLIGSVPPGVYLARASYRNDGKVMDPDWIVKNGYPIVSVGIDTVDRDFSVTGAVELISPTNQAVNIYPVEVQGTRPVFHWMPYSSADDYVIEVTDQSGRVIWGGFEDGWRTRRVVIAKTSTSIEYNTDSTAIEALQVGHVYRWRIYASKDDLREPTGWKLVSVSEEQRGIVRIID